MIHLRSIAFLVLLGVPAASVSRSGEPSRTKPVPLGSRHLPACSDDRLVVELVAHEPDIVTPTGLTVDEHGRIWVIENHTHQRQASYKGPASDRIRVLDDFDDHGHARTFRTFADGFRNAMSLAVEKDGSVLLATRSTLYRLRDRDGDGVADDKRRAGQAGYAGRLSAQRPVRLRLRRARQSVSSASAKTSVRSTS